MEQYTAISEADLKDAIYRSIPVPNDAQTESGSLDTRTFAILRSLDIREFPTSVDTFYVTARKMPLERAVVGRNVDRATAKTEIRKLISERPAIDEWDIAEELRLSVQLVVDLCAELVREGKIKSS